MRIHKRPRLFAQLNILTDEDAFDLLTQGRLQRCDSHHRIFHAFTRIDGADTADALAHFRYPRQFLLPVNGAVPDRQNMHHGRTVEQRTAVDLALVSRLKHDMRSLPEARRTPRKTQQYIATDFSFMDPPHHWTFLRRLGDIRASHQGIGHEQIDGLDTADDGDAERLEFLFDFALAVDARHDEHFMVLYQAFRQPQHGDTGAGSVKLIIQKKNLHALPSKIVSVSIR